MMAPRWVVLLKIELAAKTNRSSLARRESCRTWQGKQVIQFEQAPRQTIPKRKRGRVVGKLASCRARPRLRFGLVWATTFYSEDNWLALPHLTAGRPMRRDVDLLRNNQTLPPPMPHQRCPNFTRSLSSGFARDSTLRLSLSGWVGQRSRQANTLSLRPRPEAAKR